MEVGIFQVDSFTSEVFKGNPAGVCITDTSLDEATMLAIAAEMAVSETAFLSLDTMQLRTVRACYLRTFLSNFGIKFLEID